MKQTLKRILLLLLAMLLLAAAAAGEEETSVGIEEMVAIEEEPFMEAAEEEAEFLPEEAFEEEAYAVEVEETAVAVEEVLEEASLEAYGTFGAGVAWTLDSDGLLTISGTGPMEDYEGGKSPLYSYRSAVRTVRIGNGVTSIGAYVFYYCNQLTAVTIPSSVTAINYGAFAGCTSLAEIEIPDSVTVIGDSAFSRCTSLTEIVIPSGVTSIGTRAFNACSSLQAISVPASVTSIGSYAFTGCDSLTDIQVACNSEAFAHFSKRTDTLTVIHREPVTDPAVPATCTSTGLTEGTHCPGCGEVLEAQQIVPAMGHAWRAAVYTWAGDYSTVTATRTCMRDASHRETETVRTTSRVTREPSASALGETTYISAAFTNKAFQVQTRTVANIPFISVGTVTGIAANPVDTNAARIRWSSMPNASGYQLERKDSENGTFKWIKNCTTAEVNNYALTPGADYWYRVRAYRTDQDGTKIYGGYSSAVHVHILGTIDNLTVRGLDTNCAFLKWDKVAGATGYQVFRAVAGSGEYIWVKNCSTAQIANYDLTAGTTYYYKLRAYIDLPDGSRAYGPYSGGVKVDILPQAVITSVSYDGAAQISWYRIPGVTGYQIFYLQEATDGIYKWVMNCVPDTVTSVKITKNLVYGTNFYFRVRGYIDYPDDEDHPRYYGQFSGADHTTVKFDLTRPVLNNPTFGKDGISLSWTNEDGDVDGYEVLYKVAGQGDFTVLAETGRSALSYNWKDYAYGTNYYFQIRSYKLDGTGTRQYSSASAAKSCQAKFTLTQPVLNDVVCSVSGISLSWTNADGNVDGYEVLYKVAGQADFSVLVSTGKNVLAYNWAGYTYGTNYYFQVRSYKLDATGARRYSTSSAVKYCAAKFGLSQPVMNTPVFSKANIALSWTNADQDVDGYEVLCKAVGEADFSVLAETNASTLSYKWTGYEYGKNYNFAVRSYIVDNAGKRQYSAASAAKYIAAKFTFSTPEITSVNFAISGITINWKNTDTDVAGYEILYKTSAQSSYTTLTSVGASGTSFTWSSYTWGTAYSFQVRSYRGDNAGKRQYSSPSTAVSCTANLTPSMVSARGTRIVSSGNAAMRVAWSDITGIDKWEMQCSDGRGWMNYGSVTESSNGYHTTIYTVTEDVNGGVIYGFRIRGVLTRGGKTCYTNWSEAETGCMPLVVVQQDNSPGSYYFSYINVANLGNMPLYAETTCLVMPLGRNYGNYLGSLYNSRYLAPQSTARFIYETSYRLRYDEDAESMFGFYYNGYYYVLTTDSYDDDGYGLWFADADLDSNDMLAK